MIYKFTITKEDKIYECERVVIGKGVLKQTIHVAEVGSKTDSNVYGASKHSASTMIVAARRIAQEILLNN
ncbi:MAG TPA: hypothetical protein VF556_09935 [Pyrinomonadaceae bacterium]|jgi:hypothetical protein